MTTHEGHEVQESPEPPVRDEDLDVEAVIAIQVIVAIAVYGLVGLLVDLVLGTRPWVQFIGIVFGTIVALALVRRHATPVAAPDASHD